MAVETRKQKIKRLYEANQNGLDKVLLSVILALPPVLIFLYDKFDKTNTIACYLYLWAVGSSFVILILFLLGFSFAKLGCNSDDFAHSRKCKHKKARQLFANLCFFIADYLELLYLLGVIFVLCLLFALFYFNLKSEDAIEIPPNHQQIKIHSTLLENKTLNKFNIIEKERVMSENNESTDTQNNATPTKEEIVRVINSNTPLKSERTTSIQSSSGKSKGNNNE